MKDPRVEVLIVEQNPEINGLICRTLTEIGISCKGVLTGRDALLNGEPGLLLLNNRLADIEVLELVRKFKDKGHTSPFIVITGEGDERVAVEMMKNGAHDYIVMGTGFLDLLPPIISRALAEVETKRQLNDAENRFMHSAVQQVALIEKSPIPMVLVDSHQDITLYNDKFIETFGYTLDDVSTAEQWWSTVYPDPDYRELVRVTWQAAIDQAAASGTEVPEQEWDVTCKDGTKKTVTFNSMAIGEHAIIVLNDVSEQRRTEKELRDSEEKFSTVFERAPLPMTITSLEDGSYLDVNEGFIRVTGYQREDVIGSTSVDIGLISVDDRNRLKEEMLRTGHIANMELKLRKQDGSAFFCLYSGEIITVAGVPSLLSNVQDISQLKQAESDHLELEKQLLQGEHLESLGVLAGGIAHDFNNLLTGVMGNAELALVKMPASSLERHAILNILKASERAADLAQQMLAYSGRGAFVKESTDLSLLVEEMVHLLKSSVPKTVDLRLDLDPDLCSVHVDVTQIRQVVMNLITNAAEATVGAHGVIDVRTDSRICGIEDLQSVFTEGDLTPGRYVCLEVRDNGCGMDEKTLKRIFEPFFSTKFTGRGLGLAALQGIVRGHKGIIKVESESGAGSLFRVLLPAFDGSEPVPEDSGDPEQTLVGEGAILIVDDEECVREVAGQMVECLGFSALFAGDGKEAVEVYRQHFEDISLVILDMTMPRMDGEEALDGILSISADARVIVSSGFSKQEVSELFDGKVLAGIIQKPFRLGKLEEAIRVALEGSPEE